MKLVAWVLCPFLFFAFINIITVYISGRSFGRCLPVTMMCAALVLYFSQLLLKSFYPGYYLMLALAAAGAVLLIIKRKDSKLAENLCSFGFYGFVALYLIFIIVDFHSHVSQWDELSHWGKMVKEMLRLNSFYSVPASNLLAHKEYPPLISLLEMLWCMLTGGYSEDTVMAALHIFEFSLILPPALDRLEEKTKPAKAIILSSIFTVVITLIICTLDIDSKFNTIYTDVVMPVMYAYAVLLITDRETRNSAPGYIAILITQTALIISKQMSIAYVMLVWFLYTALIIFDGEKGNAAKKAPLSAGVLAAPGINYIIWSRYVKSLGLQGQFDFGHINARTFAQIISGNGDGNQRYTFKNYFRALYEKQLTTGLVNLTYISATLLALLLLLAIYKLNNDSSLRKKYLSYAALLIIGAAGYAFTMMVLYLFCFSSSEMLELASYQRYMGSYVISEYLVLLYLLLETLHRKSINLCSFSRAALIFGVAIIVLDSSKLGCLCPRLFYDEAFYDFRNQADTIQSSTESGNGIMILSSNNIWYKYYINYYLEDRKIDTVGDWDTGTDVNDLKYWAEVEEHLAENDYLYIVDTSENIYSTMGDLFLTAPADRTLYRINTASGIPVLETVA